LLVLSGQEFIFSSLSTLESEAELAITRRF
jgi:hypothetical protein